MRLVRLGRAVHARGRGRIARYLEGEVMYRRRRGLGAGLAVGAAGLALAVSGCGGSGSSAAAAGSLTGKVIALLGYGEANP